VDRQPDYRSAFEFRNGHLIGSATDSTGEHRVDKSAGSDRLDFSVASLICSALPAASSDVVLRAYDVAQLGSPDRSVHFQRAGRDSILWHVKRILAWRSTTDVGGQRTVSWSSDDGRQLRWEIDLQGMQLIGELKDGGQLR
jgi:hypothetical protein